MIPAARDTKTSEVPVGSHVGAVVVGGGDLLGVEVDAESREFPVIRVDGEASLGNCCLVDSHTPHYK